MHGGVTFFRGTGASATAYLESDHHRADEYYLEEDGQLAERFVYGPEGTLDAVDSLDSERYKQWVDWVDPDTGEVRGKPKGQARLRQDDGVMRDLPASPRFAEMTVNCDKSLSVAAALSAEVSAALDEAQREAAQAMSEFVAENAVTRVGPMGGQRLVKVERFEAVAVVHKTSRAGDPHRHIHVQWNTRVFAEGKWRGLWTTPTLKQQGALRGIGESTIRSHEGLRTALANAGLTFDTATGKVVELSKHAELLSKRRAQVQENIATLEAAWRENHPGQEPSPEQRRMFDFKAWALDRPGKKAKNREVSQAGWIEELRAADLPIDGFNGGVSVTRSLADLDRDQIAAEAIAFCEGKASAWSLHQLQAAVADQVAAAGVIADRAELNAFVTDTAKWAARGARSISDPRDGHMPDHVRHITSERVIAVEDELKARFTARVVAAEKMQLDPRGFADTNLGQAQKHAAQIVVSDCGLGVIEGAAGSGKTTMLREAKKILDAEGWQLVVLAPTLKGAQEAARSLEAPAFSVHKLLHANGFRWDRNGRYTRLKPGESDPRTGKQYRGPADEYRLKKGARVVVDEAGMIDQDTALALTQLADQYGAGIVLMGDRAQLPAVGRGGVLDHAAKIAVERADIDVVHRFTDPKYASLSLRMRDRDKPASLFTELYEGGHIRIHTSTEEAVAVMTEQAAATILTGGTVALATPTNEMATQINAVMQDQMSAAGRTRPAKFEVVGVDGLVLRHGDTIMTRNNDSMLGIANRETYTVHTTHADGSITVSQGKGKEMIRLPKEYVTEYVHLGYASTEYGAQGATETTGAGLLDVSSTAGGTYVAATRGREANTLHLVAASTEDAQAQFVDIMGRDTADRGIEAAQEALAREIDGLDLSMPQVPASVPEQIEQPQNSPGSPPSIQENPETVQSAHGRDPKASTAPTDPEADTQLRERRVASETRTYERKLAAWESRRAAYEAKHGYTPETWQQLNSQAVDAHREAKAHRETIEHNVASLAEQGLRVDHAQLAAQISTARRDLDQAGLFGRNAARRALAEAEARYEAAFGVQPEAGLNPEPPLQLVQKVRAQALTEDNQDLSRALAVEKQTAEQAEVLKDSTPKWCTEQDRPKPPVAGTPDQERAKDRAFAGRAAQNKRAKTSSQTTTPSPGQSPGLER
ncbi:hypothetical protein Pure05_40960 [Paenarthrobacter ureafaciens]|nr:hypothetical protein Pure01_40740 [Paenarthrobacter ureafaciens]GLU65860.1 hypothetical protein Pure02_41100 [Paenarthrobacter ureafaciens]GLU70147.1 hypothetical protein Pure03_41230 [Paenarthrobacter ureafaciens]GLU74416.1 hypothetical protein Pure04_41310 [Paenarthrobacter ureafaciens]GLU78656.1 hypothetical protein Pure05_40960 [Paenarthrobacter ureafaciens]